MPSIPTGLPSQSPAQVQPSPSLGSVESEGRPQTRSSATEKPLLGSSEGHSPPRDRNDPYTHFEPVTPQAPAAARSRDGHMVRGPSRRTAMGSGPASTSGLGWIVPVDEKPQHVCVAFYCVDIRS